MLLITSHDQFKVAVIASGSKGWGIHEVNGTEVTANGNSDTPANHLVQRAIALAAGKSGHGLSR